ncbi:invasin domain 3-containing protein [Arthrobacter russicus]|uniref:Big-1 domain-containing protein n=1 Tax=Arthrobacter russicus TaxID=172040 RepID=A0ABU1JDN4_9MICC|nr:invasin domain 3-containing protein [Arthrobacter russicus]MDR6270528.1 hypothetical protein [Arthrobacter russicus]
MLPLAMIAQAAPAVAASMTLRNNPAAVSTLYPGSQGALKFSLVNDGQGEVIDLTKTSSIVFNAPEGTVFPAQTTVVSQLASTENGPLRDTVLTATNCVLSNNSRTLSCGLGTSTGGTRVTWDSGWERRFLPQLQVASTTAPGNLPDTAGTMTFEVVSGGTTVGNASGKVRVMVDPAINPSDGYQLTGKGQAGFTVTVTDAAGNVLGTPTVDANGNWTLTPSTRVATGTVVRVAQTDDANVTRTAQTTIGSPAPDARKSEFVVSTGDRAANGTASHTVTVTLRDAQNNPIPDADTSKLAATSTPANATISAWTNNNNGTYTATMTSTVAGNKTIATSFDGASIAVNGNGTARFVSGPVDVTNAGTKFTVTEGDKTADGVATHTVTVTLVDKDGNPVPNADTAKLTAASDPANATIGTWTNNGDGTYTATITSTVAGNKKISTTFDGGTIKASGNDTARFVAGGVDVTNAGTKFTVTEGARVADGDGTHNVTVTLVDKDGNPVLNADTAKLAAVSDPANATIGAWTNNGDGTYTAKITTTVAGNKKITTSFDGGAIKADGNDVARFTAGGVDVNNAGTKFTVTEGNRVADGTATHTVTVTLVDKDGNPVPDADTSKLTAASDPANATIGTWTNNGDGTYTATITSTVAGAKKISTSFDSGAIKADGNDMARFVAGPVDVTNAGTKFTVTEGNRVADGSATHSVTVTLADKDGNPVLNADTTKLAAVSDPSNTTIGAWTNNGDGTYTATITSTVAGAKKISTSFDSGAIKADGNDTARFIAGPVDVTNAGTKFTVTEGNRIADGTATHTVTVTLADKDGNPVPNADTTKLAAVSDPTNTTIGAWTNNGDGTYTATVTTTVAGNKKITTSFDGGAIKADGNDTARFVAGGVDVTNAGTKFTVTEGDKTADGTATHTITVTLADKDGNPVLNADTTKLAASSDPTDTRFGAWTNNGDGTYTTTVTSTVAGSKKISTVFDGGTIKADGNDTARFVAGGVDVTNAGTKFTVTEGNRVADGVATHTVTVSLADKDGNPVLNADTAKLAAVSDPANANFGSWTNNGDGTYTATVTTTVAGDKKISTSFDGGAIKADGNDVARFTAGPVDVTNAGTKYTVTEGEKAADGTATHTVTVTLADKDGNPVLNADTTKLAAVSDPANTTIGAWTNNGDGTYTATITSTVAGDKKITTAFDGGTIKADGNDVARFTAGPVDVTNAGTKFTVTEGEKTADGVATHTVTVTLVDKDGNPVPNADTTKLAAVSDPTNANFGSWTNNGDGTYTATVTTTVAGDKKITTSFDGGAIKADGNDVARFTAGPVDVTNAGTKYTVTEGEKTADGTATHTVTVTLVDKDGNPVLNADTTKLAAFDPANSTYGAWVNNGDGTYTATIASTVAGDKTINASYDENSINADGNTIAVFVAGPVDVTNAGTKFTVTEGEKTADGTATHTVTATLVDKDGNPVLNADTAKLVATSDPANTTIGDWAKNGDGTYTATITSTVAGDKKITTAFDGGTIKADGNDVARFVAGPVDVTNAGTKFTVTEGEKAADGTATHTVTVTLVDKDGNPVLNADTTKLAAVSDPANTTIGEWVNNGDGTYTATVTTTVAGDKKISTSFDGGAIKADGNDVARFVAGPVDVTNAGTKYTVTEGEKTADGVATHTVTVTLVDKDGNPVLNADTTKLAAVSDPANANFGSWTNNGDGSYTATVTSTIAGDKKITVSFDGGAITADGNDVARFTAGAVDVTNAGTKFTVTEGEKTADGVATHSVTVTLVDKDGNPVLNADTTKLTATSDPANASFGDWVNNGDGSYTATVTSTVAGDKKVTVAFDSGSITADGNDVARFTAGAVDVTNAGTKFTVTEGEKTADGVATHTVTVTLVDKDGNPVLNADASKLTATSDPNNTTIGKWVNNGNGTYTATITSTVAGAKTITVSFDSAPIKADGNDVARFAALPVDPPAPKDDLAITGLTALPIALLGALILGLGLLLMLTTRRKRQNP